MNHRIFFYVNVTKTGSDGVLRKATEIAARSGYQCKVYEDASCMFADCIEEDEDEPACIVTIGGDGTTLRAVSHAVNQGIEIITPILGINLGKIGFFSETSIEGFEETLKQFSEGDYTIETDRMLKASFKDGREFFALNDFLAYKSGFSSVSHIELGVDGGDVTSVCSMETEKLFDRIKEHLYLEDAMTTKEVANRLGLIPLQFQPGESFQYGTSADVLGAVIEVISGKTFGEFLKEE